MVANASSIGWVAVAVSAAAAVAVLVERLRCLFRLMGGGCGGGPKGVAQASCD